MSIQLSEAQQSYCDGWGCSGLVGPALQEAYGGEDAFFISNAGGGAMGVADGVGAGRRVASILQVPAIELSLSLQTLPLTVIIDQGSVLSATK